MTRQNKSGCRKLMVGGVLMLSASLIIGCSHRPKEVLGEKEMVSLMADMELAEAYMNTAGYGHGGPDGKEKIGKGVLLAHGVTQEELDTTLAWYGRNLDDYSNLFEKVDKEINARRKKLLNDGTDDNAGNSGDMLWQYGSHGVISALGNSDSWILSLPGTDLEKGDILEWSMHILNPSQLSGVLGVEYEDGTADAVTNVLVGRQKLELKLTTDTAKSVKRIYGTMRLKDEYAMPLFADSIMLRRLPFDSLEYNRHSSHKHYRIPVRKQNRKAVEKKDTLQSDSVGSASLKRPSEIVAGRAVSKAQNHKITDHQERKKR